VWKVNKLAPGTKDEHRRTKMVMVPFLSLLVFVVFLTLIFILFSIPLERLFITLGTFLFLVFWLVVFLGASRQKTMASKIAFVISSGVFAIFMFLLLLM